VKTGLMFFASDDAALHAADRYRLVVESARFGDRHGFSSVWVPERHFTALGSLYPNPAVLHAALARETERIALRAGSVVLPLHDPLRVAEEWAVVDNLSGGRVGLSFASGWNPDDFAFFPDRYARRNEVHERAIPVVRALWRGDPVEVTSGTGRTVSVTTYPRPVQPELPVWMTAASNPATFAKAGRLGLNLLTHVLDQGVPRLAEQIETYRKARADAGWDPATGEVTVMLHTFVGADEAAARELARRPYCAYLKSNIGLLKGLAHSRGRDVDVTALPPEELDAFVEFLYDRFAGERALIGSPESCLPLARELAAAGVDEVACLLDFGPDTDAVLANLPHLDRLRQQVEGEVAAPQRRSPAAAARTGPVATVAPEPAVDRTAPDPAVDRTAPVDLDEVRGRCPTEVTGEEFYTVLAAAGAEYGPAMRCLERAWVGDGEVLGELRLPAGAGEDGYGFHPGLLDNAFLLLGALAPGALTGTAALSLPVGFRRLELDAPPAEVVFSHVVRTPAAEEPGTMLGDVRITDPTGVVLARAEGLKLQLVEGDPAAGVGGLVYRTEWREAEPPPEGDAAGRWLLLDGWPAGGGADTAVGDRLAAALTARGGEVLRAPGGADDVAGTLAGAAAGGPLRGVVLLWPLVAGPGGHADPPDGTAELAAAQQAGVESVLALARAALALDGGSRTGRLWLVTRGAVQPGDEAGPACGVAQAPVWGFGRVLAAEHPDAWGGLVDLDPAGAGAWPGGAAEAAEAPEATDALEAAEAVEAAEGLVRVLLGDRAEDQVALRGGRWLVPRLVRAPEWAQPATQPATQPAGRLDPDGTYLLVGGLGDIGLAIAARLVRHGARHLVLAGRTGLADGDPRHAAVAELAEQGVRVHLTTLDVTDAAAVAALPAVVAAAGLPPVAGVVHLAGVIHGATVAAMDLAALREVCAPKVAGAWHLHRTFRDVGLFLLVSALPAVVGPIGVGAANYAAANAFLDALARHRRRHGLAGCALGYGPWNEVGLAVREGGLEQLAAIGLGSMRPAEALEVLDRVVERDPEQVTVARVDWAGVAAAFPHARGVAQLSELVGAGSGDPGLRRRLAEAEPEEARELLAGHVRLLLARVLRAEPAAVEADQAFTAMGLDSLMALDLRNRIDADLGVAVPLVRLLEGPTLDDFTATVLDLAAEIGIGTSEEREEFTV
jgi:phthiocerol/phenolphthiocerol synthesis type-I polyketide synthase D